MLSGGSDARNSATQDDDNHQLTDRPVSKYPQDAGLGPVPLGSPLLKGATSLKTDLSSLGNLREYVKASDIILVSSWKKKKGNEDLVIIS